MTWFFVDDHLHDHRKARKAGPEAMGLWVLAGSWCADNLTDGFVPADVAARWGGKRLAPLAERLIVAGLWVSAEQDGEPGWQFHEWTTWQKTREEHEALRAKRAAAGALGGRRSGQTRSKREANAEALASTVLEANTNPSPPLPSPVEKTTTSSSTRTRGTRIPDNWQPTEDLKTWTLQNTPEAAHTTEVDKFRDYWRSQPGQKGVKTDWDATWRNWARKTHEDRAAKTAPKRSTTDERVAQAQSLRAKYAAIDAAEGIATVTHLALGGTA